MNYKQEFQPTHRLQHPQTDIHLHKSCSQPDPAFVDRLTNHPEFRKLEKELMEKEEIPEEYNTAVLFDIARYTKNSGIYRVLVKVIYENFPGDDEDLGNYDLNSAEIEFYRHPESALKSNLNYNFDSVIGQMDY